MLVAVDDAQWLDESSFGAILFAARRLFADAVAIVIATRAPTAATSRRSRSKGSTARRRPRCSPVTPARPLPPGAAERLFEATLGNPLALVELAAAATEPAAGPLLEVETSVEHAFAPRIAALPEPARRLLALAAAEDSGELAVLERAASTLGLDFTALAAAERAGLVTVERRPARVLPSARALGRLPLGAARTSGAPRTARSPHADADPDRRAWHRAAAALGPDEAAARRSSARRPARATRGAYTAAASAFERAARLTAGRPDRRAAPVRGRRGGLAGRPHRAREPSGSPRRARACEDPRCARDRPPARPRRAALRAACMDAHDILVAAAESAPPAQAVVMLAEACRGVLLRRATRGDAAHGAAPARAGEPERRRARALLRRRSRSGWRSSTRATGEEGAAAGCARRRRCSSAPTRSRATRGCSTRRRWARCGCARPSAGARWWRARSSRRARRARSARCRPRSGSRPATRRRRTASRSAIALYEEAIRLARETGQATALCGGAGRAGVRRGAAGRRGRLPRARRGGARAHRRARAGLLPAVGAGRAGDARARPRQRRARRRVADGEGAAARRARDRRPRRLARARARRGPACASIAIPARGWRSSRPPPRPRASRGRSRGSRAAAGCSAGSDEHFADALRLHAPHARPLRGGAHAACVWASACAATRRRAEAREPLRRAVEAFDALGARALGRARAARAGGQRRDRAPARPAHARPAHPARAAGRARAGRRAHDPRGGGEALPQPEDRRLPPAPRLPQARDRLAGRPGRRPGRTPRCPS